MVGGPNQADKNIFNTDLLYYIVLDSLSGPSDAQPFWAGYSVTTMVPFSQSVWALAAYNEYNITDTLLLEEKMLDSLDVTGLGKVVLFDALITGVEQNLSQDLSLYPNPANDFVMLNTAALNGTSTIRLFDVTGKMVDNFNTTQSSAQLMIPVQQLSSGLYFVTVENNGNFFTAKFSRK
jgi:hypothetical protein